MVVPRRAALWSPEAVAGRDRIWNHYVQVVGRNTAIKILRDIGEVITLIEDHPFSGRFRNEVRPGLHSFVANPHVVFYRVENGVPEMTHAWQKIAGMPSRACAAGRNDYNCYVSQM
jgi:plasmid stabilization system protein ParE